MALEGTLRDVGIDEIFQLIGLQRKTGVLTIAGKEDTVTLSFSDGLLVGTESEKRRVETRLGSVLVSRGDITADQLDEALKIQRDTLQRLGYVLTKENFITRDALRQALLDQMQRIVYRLFLWSDGYFHFQPEQAVSYDRELITPMSPENLLLEAARIKDEWPMIQRRVKSPRTVYRLSSLKGISVINERGEDVYEGRDVEGEMLPVEFGGAASDEVGERSLTILRIDMDEQRVFPLVDGQRTVQQIVDAARQPEFDTYKALAKLIEKGIIVRAYEVEPDDEEAPPPASKTGLERSPGLRIAAALAGLSMALLVVVRLGPMAAETLPVADALRPPALQAAFTDLRLQRVEFALRLYRLGRGRFPTSLTNLHYQGYLPDRDLKDTWGRELAYQGHDGGYVISSAGPDQRFKTADDRVVRFSSSSPAAKSLFVPPFHFSDQGPAIHDSQD